MWFDTKGYLEEKRIAVEKALGSSIVTTCPETETITESMRYSLMAGGKRIRPIMCIAACEMFGGTAEMAMPTAVAIEMIHTMSLMHDDLPAMDNDSLRRGVPTNHVVFGEDIAILAGDALLSEAFEHCATHTPKSVPAERVVEVIRRLGRSVGPVGLAGGQVLDLQCEGKAGVTLDQLRWIHAHKTAALLQVAVATGAILAGASLEDVKALDAYALDVGLAFQVADDILDVTASSAELGKTAGKDEEVDKTTYPKLLGLEASKVEAQRLVDSAAKALAPYGDKAKPLLALGDFIITRKN
jgi:geranylgeranyl diphosphate synthase type II